MYIELTGWMIPTSITFIAIVCAFYFGRDNGNTIGFLSGLGVIFTMVPVLIVSLISGICYGIFK